MFFITIITILLYIYQNILIFLRKMSKESNENDFTDFSKSELKHSKRRKLEKIDWTKMPNIKKIDWTKMPNNPYYLDQKSELTNLYKVNDSDEFDDLPELIPVNSDEFLDTAEKGHIKCDSQSDNK